MIGPENSPHHLNQSDAKLKTNRLGRKRFPARFKQFTLFHFEFSLANDYVKILAAGIT